MAKTAKQMAAEKAEREAAKLAGKKAPTGQRTVKHYMIANKLKQLREDQKLSVSDVAKATGIGTQTISSVESGSDIGLSRALMLSAFYEMPVNEIWTGEPVEKGADESGDSDDEAGQAA